MLVLPRIEQIIDTWNLELDVFPIIIINKLESKYIKLGQEAKILYDNFINEKNDKKDYMYEERLDTILKNKEMLLKQIKLYVEKNKNEEFIATKEIKRWLINTQRSDTLEEIKESGFITHRTALKIQEPKFIDLIINKLNDYFSRKNFHIKIEKFIQQGFVIKILDQYQLKIFAKYSDFMIDYGDIVFGNLLESPPSKFYLMKNTKIYDEYSKETILGLLDIHSRKYGVYIKDMEEDIFCDHGDVLIYLEKEKKYIMPKIDSIVEKYKGIALKYEDNKTIKDYINDMQNSKLKRIKESDIKEFKYTRDKLA